MDADRIHPTHEPPAGLPAHAGADDPGRQGPEPCRLALTNLAWDPVDDAEVAALLRQHGIGAIDIAPSKYFADPTRATPADIRRLRQWWEGQGIRLAGMQSLLHGMQGLNLFGPPDVQQRMLDVLRAVCDIGAGLGASRLVFGSPANRDRSALDDRQTRAVALDFFGRLGDVAAAAGVLICVEAAAAHYGSNFLTDTASSIELVRTLAHPALAITLDTANLHMNGESIDSVLPAHADLIGHIHASEKDLVALGDGSVPHAAMGEAIRRHLPDALVCVEILKPRSGPWQDGVARSLRLARRCYG